MVVFISFTAATLTFPFVQSRRDELKCDTLCQGGQTSLRSGLGLVGAALVGRASDRLGRIPCLWLGIIANLVGLAINFAMDDLRGMWLSLVPVALLNQNFSVAKALFSDYIDEVGGSDADRAGAVGKLGMALGFSFMAGPILATLLVKEYKQVLSLSALMTLGAMAALALLPTPKAQQQVKAGGAATATPSSVTTTGLGNGHGSGQNGSGGGVYASALAAAKGFVDMPVLQTRGAQLLVAMRLLMALAFHMFAPIWQVSIRRRFNFAPKDHAQFMGLIGLTYALSQGVVAKPLIKKAGDDPTKLISLCVLLLGGSRPFALHTSSVVVVYCLYVPMVIALGVMNTAITTACANLAAGEDLGGLFGVLESVESASGMVGPALGGLLSAWSENGALVAVCGSYAVVLVLVGLFFERHVVRGSKAKASE